MHTNACRSAVFDAWRAEVTRLDARARVLDGVSLRLLEVRDRLAACLRQASLDTCAALYFDAETRTLWLDPETAVTYDPWQRHYAVHALSPEGVRTEVGRGADLDEILDVAVRLIASGGVAGARQAAARPRSGWPSMLLAWTAGIVTGSMLTLAGILLRG